VDAVGDLFHLAVPEDVRQLQATVRQDLTGLVSAVEKCPQNALTEQDRVEWGAMRTRAEGYLALEPSLWSTTTQIAAGQAVLKDLSNWHTRLKACGVGPASGDPSAIKPSGGGLFGALNTEDMLKIGLLVLAAYYGAKLFK
jgi:hypothetical protein